MKKVLKNTIDKYYIMLSYDEINEFYRLFQIVEQQMVQMKIKRLIKFNYIDNVTRYLFDERLRKQTLKKYDAIFEVLFFLYNLIFYFFCHTSYDNYPCY